MGVNWQGLKALCAAKRAGVDFTNTVTIGRLARNVSAFKAREIMQRNGLNPEDEEFTQMATSQYCEPIFRILGARIIDSIDESSYEGATIITDLNDPILDSLVAQYDVVYDGGTLEHIFNVPQCLNNYMRLIKVGGSIFIQTAANNWFGHGFYQFGADLFYRVFSPENGFRVRKLLIQESIEFGRSYEVPDPEEIQSRIELSNSWVGIFIMVHAQRESDVPLFSKSPQQSDYAAAWLTSKESSTRLPSTSIGATATLKDRLRRKIPSLVPLKHRILYRFSPITRLFKLLRARNYHKTHSVEFQPDKFRTGSSQNR